MAGAIKLEKCPVCGTIGCDKFVTFRPPVHEPLDEGAYMKCKGCGLVYLNPRPSQSDICEFMENIYNHNREEEIVVKYWRDQTWYIKLIEKYMPAKGRFLEIGCGSGQLLKSASDRGWDVTGVEVSSEAVKYVKDTLRLNILEGDFDVLEQEPESYDAIVMLNVVEHLCEPKKTLKKVAQVLKPGGVFLLRTPNLDYRQNIALMRKGLPITASLTTLHFYYFNLDSLSAILKEAGFSVTYHTTYNVDDLAEFKNNLMSLNIKRAALYFQNYVYGIIQQGLRITVIARK